MRPAANRPLRPSPLWLAVCAALALPTSAWCAETLLLDVSVNDQSLEGIVIVERNDDGRLMLSADDWARARLKPASAAVTLADGRIAYALDAVAGLHYDLDRSVLTLKVSAPADAFNATGMPFTMPARPGPQSPPAGFYLDYDLSSTHDRNGRGSHGALLEGVAFNRFGTWVSGLAWRSTDGGGAALRTDTFWQRDLPARMQTLVIGDTVTSAGGWSRPVRYGGLRFARDFSVAPGYITYPMPSINGSAALPSTVDVLVNDRRADSASVPPGPFELTDVPVVNGAGDIQLVVRDLLGRETVIRQEYYVAPQLLARGLSDFSYEAGLVREGYGTRDDRYGNAFASGTYRRGLTDWFTGEVRAEADRDRVAAGLALTAVVGQLGVVGLAAGWSVADGRQGGHYVASAQRIGRRGGISVALGHFDRDFRQFAQFDGELQPRDQATLTAGVRLGRRLTAGFNFTRRSDWSGNTFSLLGGNLGVQLEKGGFLGLSASKGLAGDRGWRAGINLVVPLGQRRTLAAGTLRQPDHTRQHSLQWSQAAPTGPGWGWRASLDDGAARRVLTEVVLNTTLGQLTADASVGRGERALRLGANGSIGRMHGLAFAARRIDEGAFAVVRVGKLAGVDVSLSNQLAARTNRNGLALVTGLLPYQLNTLSLDPDALPLDAQIGAVVATTVPYARSGAFVDFPVMRNTSALLELLRPDGSPVPAGARVSLGPGLSEFTVLRRGEVYLTGIGDAHHLQVRWQDGACSVNWKSPPRDFGMTTRLTCGAEP